MIRKEDTWRSACPENLDTRGPAYETMNTEFSGPAEGPMNVCDVGLRARRSCKKFGYQQVYFREVLWALMDRTRKQGLPVVTRSPHNFIYNSAPVGPAWLLSRPHLYEVP